MINATHHLEKQTLGQAEPVVIVVVPVATVVVLIPLVVVVVEHRARGYF